MNKELKKYAAIIGEKTPENTKVLNEVFDELEKAGFGKARRNCHYSIVEFYKGYIGHLSLFDGRMKTHEFLWPSDVLARAHELDGARKLEDTPPDGMRLVTDQERKDNDAPEMDYGVKYAYFYKSAGLWSTNLNSPKDWENEDCIYAIPADYVFPKPWEIAPEGYRIVTEEERGLYKFPSSSSVRICFKDYSDWSLHSYTENWYKDIGEYNYAVPLDFTFEPEVVEMTMAEVCELAGKKVKIVK